MQPSDGVGNTYVGRGQYGEQNSVQCHARQRSSRRLAVTLGIENLLAAHGADTLLVSTGMTVVGANLVDFGAADAALFECSCCRVKSVLFGCEQLVLIFSPSSTFHCVPGTSLPDIRSDHLPKLTFTLITHHFNDFISIQNVTMTKM